MAEVFVTNRTNVHIAPTPDNPNGGVVVFQQGLNTVPPGTESEPYIANLIVTSEPEVALAHKAADARVVIDEHLAEGTAAIQTAEKEQLDAKTAASEEWTAANQAAIDAGTVFSDPHPDPVVQRSITLTGDPAVYAAAGFVGKASDSQPANAPARDVPQGGHQPRVTPETKR